MRKIVAIILFLCTPFLLFSTDVPGGNVSGTWSAMESPYMILGDITVMANDSLVIEPGVDILFSNDTQLDVYGFFSAEGTEEDSIRFEAAADNWNGINLHTGILDTVFFMYCRITKMTGMGIKTDSGNESKFVHCHLQDNTAMDQGALSANSSFIYLESCFLVNNSPAALYTYYSIPRIYYCTFMGRSSVRLLSSFHENIIEYSYFDGMNHDNNRALETDASNYSYIHYCEFCNFHSDEGSAIKGSSFYETLRNCYLHNNTASMNGGAVSVDTGMIYDCVFENNYAGQNGGAYYGDGPQEDNVYRNNHADLNGGAMWVSGLASGGNRILFEGNSAGDKGGALYAQSIGVGLHNVIAFNNSAIEGGFLYLNGNPNYSQEIQNCLVHHNSANGGGAINSTAPIVCKNSLFAKNLAVDAAVTISANDTIRFTNTAFYSNHGTSPSDNIQSGNSLQVAKIKLLNCYVDGGQESIHLNENDYLSFVNCTEQDPQFLLATDAVGTSALANNANFHFINGSSLIDGGTNIPMQSTDLDQNPRILGASVDIGPYEGFVELIPGDFNFDGFVNVTDIEILNDNYGCLDGCILLDLNNDGVVGSSDVMYWMGLMGP